MEIVYIRHAESLNNHQFFKNRNYKDCLPDPPLSELGEKQAVELANFLANHKAEFNFDRIYISPMLRALQTADAFSHLYPDIPKIVCPWIYEAGGCREIISEEPREVLITPGLGKSEILERFPSFTVDEEIRDEGWYTSPEVELPSHVLYRAFHTVEYFSQNHPYPEERVVLVSHGNFYNHLIHAIMHRTPQANFRLGMENTAMTKIGYHNRYLESFEKWWFIEYMNRHEWLTSDLKRDWGV